MGGKKLTHSFCPLRGQKSECIWLQVYAQKSIFAPYGGKKERSFFGKTFLPP